MTMTSNSVIWCDDACVHIFIFVLNAVTIDFIRIFIWVFYGNYPLNWVNVPLMNCAVGLSRGH